MPARTLVVLWRVTERCNLACSFCAYDRNVARDRLETSAHDALTLAETLGRWRRESGRRILVSWLGGEPLLWAPLTEVSRACHLRHDLDLSLTTNGTRLHRPGIRALLIEHYAEVTVSVDATAGVHDHLRGKPGLYDALARSVTQLAVDKRTAGRGPLLRANVVLMRDTIAGFATLCRDLSAWGIEEITFNQLGGVDRPEFFPANRLLPEQVQTFMARLPALRRELASLGVVLRGANSYLERIAASANGERLAPRDCAPGRDFLFIDEAGRIAPCARTPREYGVAVDSLDSPASLTALPGRFSHARRQCRAPACADCHSTQHHGKFAAVPP